MTLRRRCFNGRLFCGVGLIFNPKSVVQRRDAELVFLGFIKIHILYHASKEPIFGIEIADELARHGYSISPGTLYPTLHRLEKEGYLDSNTRVVKGRVRRYYQTTSEGKLVLEKSKGKIKELVTEVIEEQ